jgi:threonine dehydrogenase-like Zn-dependent dehydrogenase
MMKALCWYGKNDVRVATVPDPKILNPRDAIIKITTTAICGSDLHLYDGYIPTMEQGDILGHENMGEVVEVGSAVKNLRVGDRVVVPFTIACGQCFFCQKQLWSCCDNSNPNAWMAEKLYGYSPSGLFGYSHMLGGYAGGQAEYLRVPFADVGPLTIPDGIEDEKVVFLSDIFPTGYMAAENCDIEPGDTVAIWGCGPVGQFAIKSAWMLGAARVIAIDQVPERLALAQREGQAETLNFDDEDIFDTLTEMTGGRGPDRCIDAVGMEAHGTSPDALLDRVKAAAFLATDRPHVLRQAIHACRKGGTVSVPGIYGGFVDKLPMGAVVNKALTIKSGQTHMHRYMRPLLARIQNGEIDPSFIITHRLRLADAPQGYEMFRYKQDNCIKVVLKPHDSVVPRQSTLHQ